jgi:hypothetical protein
MMEWGVTPVSISVSPCNLAPRELSTNSEGTISGLAGADGVPIVFMDGGAAAFWAIAASAPNTVAATTNIPKIGFNLVTRMTSFLVQKSIERLGARAREGARIYKRTCNMTASNASRRMQIRNKAGGKNAMRSIWIFLDNLLAKGNLALPENEGQPSSLLGRYAVALRVVLPKFGPVLGAVYPRRSRCSRCAYFRSISCAF